jgi:hypothetical protein
MIDIKNPESVTLLCSLLGGLGTLFSLIWVKIIKPTIKLLQSQEDLVKSLDTIKKELTTNGGNSLKDAVIELRNTCGRIEKKLHYIIIMLHYLKQMTKEG